MREEEKRELAAAVSALKSGQLSMQQETPHLALLAADYQRRARESPDDWTLHVRVSLLYQRPHLYTCLVHTRLLLHRSKCIGSTFLTCVNLS